MLDEELAELAKTDELALANLYRRHIDRIARYVARRITPQHEAEDVTAQIFLSMVRGLPTWKPSNAPFIAWLFRLATNAIISWNRRQRLRRWIGLSIEPTACQAAPQDDAEELHFALQQIPETYQRTLVLHYIEQLPVTTVAQVLGVAEGTVKSRLTRGRSMLKRIIESRLGVTR
jgi:RNA polymerase sigma-70 factor (ECF subfamily)